MIRSQKLYRVALGALYFFPLLALADVGALQTRATDIKTILNSIIGILFLIATVVFLWGVIMFIAKAGDAASRDKAKGIMTWGIIGLAVMAAAWGVTNVLIQFFGVQSQSPSFVSPPTFGQ